jgi:hypothetical protein
LGLIDIYELVFTGTLNLFLARLRSDRLALLSLERTMRAFFQAIEPVYTHFDVQGVCFL